MKKFFAIRTMIVMVILATSVFNSQSQNSLIWGKQFGSVNDEYSMNHVVDNNGNIYVAGKTTGVMDGRNYGLNDGFITKIDSLGNIIWTRQFGTDGDEDIQWSAVDNAGCIYITGSTTGNLTGKKSGKEDIFIVKYNPQGEMEWSKQFGTDSTDIGKGIYAANQGFIYLTGMTGGKLGQNTFGKTDCFIIKLDNQGNQIFVSQFGTPTDDCSYAITGSNGSDVFVCGTTWGDLEGKNKGFIDGFTGQFNEKGELIKYNQFGTDGFDIAMILQVDNERNMYVGGTTSGNFGGQQNGEGDAFLLKINEKGGILWNKQFGTKNHDGLRGIDFNPDISEHILVSGILCLPPAQAFIRMYTKEGNLLWERNFIATGNNSGTSGKDASFDNNSNFYHLGLTGANLFGTLIGGSDVYLVKYRLDDVFRNH